MPGPTNTGSALGQDPYAGFGSGNAYATPSVDTTNLLPGWSKENAAADPKGYLLASAHAQNVAKFMAASHAADVAKFTAAASAAKFAGSQGGSAGGAGGAGGSSGGGSGGGGAMLPTNVNPMDINSAFAPTHAYFDQQRNQITASTMQQIAHLISLHGGAAAGVKNEGAKALAALKGIGTDETKTNATQNAAVKAGYAAANTVNQNHYNSVLADMKLHGADTSQLDAANAQMAGNLGAQGANQESLGQRLSQIMGQSIADRTANATSAQTGSLNDLQRVLEGAQFNAQQAGTNASNALTDKESLARLQMQQQLQAAAIANAQANARANAASRRSGGGGSKGSGGLTPSFMLALAKYQAGDGSPGSPGRGSGDLSALYKAFQGNSGLANNAVANHDFYGYMTDLQRGTITPNDMLANMASRNFGNEVGNGNNGNVLQGLLSQAATQWGGYSPAQGAQPLSQADRNAVIKRTFG